MIRTASNLNNLFKEYLLQLEFRRDIVRNVNVTSDEIKEYYEINKEKFKGAGFDQVENIIKDIVRMKKRAEAVSKFVDQLLKEKPVTKNFKVIHRYYDSILN